MMLETFSIMVVADTHGKLSPEVVTYYNEIPKLVICLGDITLDDYKTLYDTIIKMCEEKREEKPYFCGVLGNHDPKDLIKYIKDIISNYVHLDETHFFTMNDYLFAGINGSVKYKDDDYYCTYTQYEALEIVNETIKNQTYKENEPTNRKFQRVLVCHSEPSFDEIVFNNITEDGISLNAHDGLYAIGKYIREFHPAIVMHGHLHENKTYRGMPNVFCVYGVRMFHIPNRK